jgi:hypothetical protein
LPVPITPPRINTDEQTLLSVFRTALVDSGAFNPNCVIISADTEDDTRLQPGDRYCLMSLGADSADQGKTSGAGRAFLYLDAMLRTTIYSRLALDSGARIEKYLKDNTFGLFTLISSVRNTLHMLDPQLPTGDYILAKPLRYYNRDPVQRLPETPWGKGWGRTTISWLFSYTVSLTPAPETQGT